MTADLRAGWVGPGQLVVTLAVGSGTPATLPSAFCSGCEAGWGWGSSVLATSTQCPWMPPGLRAFLKCVPLGFYPDLLSVFILRQALVQIVPASAATFCHTAY